MSIIRSRLTGVGAYLPERIVTNDDLAKIVDTSDEWIVERSGIRQRHIAAEGELTSDLATAAAREAMQDAGVTAEDIDLIVVGTTTPDDTFPATAVKVQANLGVRQGFAFDVQAVCSGFLYGLATADKYIRSGDVKTALVIGAETFSRLLDWTDRDTCVLFGDGRRRRGAEGGSRHGYQHRRGNSLHPPPCRRPPTATFCMSTAGPRAPRRSVTSTWKARKSSVTP